jgi:hypothetical protein
MDWILDLLTTCTQHSELHFTDHWHRQTSVLNLLVSTIRFLATASNSGDSSASRAQVLLSQPPAQNSCQLTTNWVQGSLPFHTNLPVFSSQTDFQLNSLTPNQLLHVPSLNWTAENSNLFLWAPSLTRGRGYLLYMMLALASIVFLGS